MDYNGLVAVELMGVEGVVVVRGVERLCGTKVKSWRNACGIK